MSEDQPRFVAFFDVDNTLLDNDALKLQLRDGLQRILGEAAAHKFWEAYEDVRRELGRVDIPETLDRLMVLASDAPVEEARRWILEFPFDQTLFPGAREALAAVEAAGGLPVILSDGDPVFQIRKIAGSGLTEMVGGRVFVSDHKEDHIGDVTSRYAAPRYLMVDDKARLLGKYKAALGDRLSTVHVLRGLYAADRVDPGDPVPDYSIDKISDLAELLPKLELVAP